MLQHVMVYIFGKATVNCIAVASTYDLELVKHKPGY